jgi:hypothetical protein
MSLPNLPTPSADRDWTGSDPGVIVPGTATATPPAVDLLQRAAQGAHASIDRLADEAEPTVRRIADGLASAEAAAQGQADAWRATGDEWVGQLRRSVRSRPLSALAAAFALGALLARITR